MFIPVAKTPAVTLLKQLEDFRETPVNNLAMMIAAFATERQKDSADYDSRGFAEGLIDAIKEKTPNPLKNWLGFQNPNGPEAGKKTLTQNYQQLAAHAQAINSYVNGTKATPLSAEESQTIKVKLITELYTTISKDQALLNSGYAQQIKDRLLAGLAVFAAAGVGGLGAILVGLVLSITVIGAPIGVPLVIAGSIAAELSPILGGLTSMTAIPSVVERVQTGRDFDLSRVKGTVEAGVPTDLHLTQSVHLEAASKLYDAIIAGTATKSSEAAAITTSI
jgi:hypothetical protein